MKNSQAATEFLITAAFAILIVIVGIAVLAYFGVLQGKDLPEKGWFPTGLDCIDRAAISPTEIGFAMKNNLESRLTISKINLLPDARDKKIAVGTANSSYVA